jgi:hypothetical protein
VSSKVWFHERDTLPFIDHFLNLFSFRDDRIQWNFLGQTAASGCVGFATFRNITPSPYSGFAGGLAATNIAKWSAFHEDIREIFVGFTILFTTEI